MPKEIPIINFIPCTCPVEEKHGHIYDQKQKRNSQHVYDINTGLTYLNLYLKDYNLSKYQENKLIKKITNQLKKFFGD